MTRKMTRKEKRLDFIGFLIALSEGSIPLISTIIVTIAYAVVTFLVYSYSCIYAFFIAKQESFMNYKTTQYKLCNRTQNFMGCLYFALFLFHTVFKTFFIK